MGKPRRLNVRRNIPVTESMLDAGESAVSDCVIDDVPSREMARRVFGAMIVAYQRADESFWRQVKKTDTCWLWTGCRNKKGYGSVNRGNVGTLAHRWSYILEHGEIKGGLHILHKCDVPLCVNPAHLYAGTNWDNAADRVARGRNVYHRGEAHGNSRLTERKIRAIRASANMPHRVIAKEYGVSQPTISSIIRRETWKHVK